MAEVILRGKRVRFDHNNAIGKGGEADIFDIGGGEVLKVFKPADHPDLALNPGEQRAAVKRIQEHQKKLPKLLELLGKLPSAVVMPQALATSRDDGRVVGYSMPFRSSTEVLLRVNRKSAPTEDIVALLRDLHTTVKAVHQASVIIGDFNDLNVLVAGRQASLIDADSMQFGQFACMTYTASFVDPRFCDWVGGKLELVRSHSTDSDWFAFTIMVMQSLLCVGPWGGVYKPADLKKQVPHPKRLLLRLSVFNSEVKYPKPAIPYGVLPDDLLHYFRQVFEKDERGEFPAQLLEHMRWTKCSTCGSEHARGACPNCSTVAPAAVKETVQVRGKVTATVLLSLKHGRVLRAEAHDGKIMWLYYESGRYKREGGVDIASARQIDATTRYRLRAADTIIGKDVHLVRVNGAAPAIWWRETVDSVGQRALFDANASHVFWIRDGVLYRDTAMAQERIGDVLRGQTAFWVGPAFGFGFYRAGTISVAFVFTSSAQSLNDSVKLPPIIGKLIDATCTFTKDRVWFFTSSQEGARVVNRCTVIRANGDVESTADAEFGDSSWLGQIHGGAAIGNCLLMPTDDGVVQVKSENGTIVESKCFPDTEPFVDSGNKLLVGSDGLYVITNTTITRLVIA